MSVRVRFAPSPTGYLHVGGARTALFNYLYAKKMGGKFILRVEDTDVERSTQAALQMQIEDLTWLQLFWDEGVDAKTLESFGPHSPYKQSQRLSIYQEHAERLLQKGMAYYDFRSDEELEALKEKTMAEEKVHRTPRPEKLFSIAEARQKIAAGEKAAIRFKVDDIRDYKLNDIVRGEVVFPSDMVGDFVLMRSNGMPVYNFCCVVDDALMKITHVFRAEEHLSNTLRQHMIYEALGFPSPQFGHLSLVLGEDRQKLSKRHGATSCHEYMERGYLPQALLNFIALLGWNPGNDQEIFTVQELIQAFDITRLNPAGAVFDETKLKWMNAMHLRALDHSELWGLLQPILKKNSIECPQSMEWVNRALSVFKTSMETLNDAIELFRPIDDSGFKIHDEAKEVFAWDTSRKVWQAWKDALEKAPDYLTSEQFDQLQNQIKDQTSVKGKNLFMPIRVSVIGKPHGSELKTLVPLIHRQSLISRVEKCLNGNG